MRAALLAILLAACHHGHGSGEFAEPGRHDHHPCDPRGTERRPVVPRVFAYFDQELDEHERELGGQDRCRIARPSDDTAVALPSDEAIRTSCDDRAEAVPKADRSACRHACIVEARMRIAGAAYQHMLDGLANVGGHMQAHTGGLDRCAAQFGSAGTGRLAETDAQSGLAWWACVTNPPLPAGFTVVARFEHGTPPKLVDVEVTGEMPALPRHRWRLANQSQGCDIYQWDVEQLEPWPDEEPR